MYLKIPLFVAGQPDQAPDAPQLVDLPVIKNYVNDPKTFEYVRAELVQVITETRAQRRPLEELWQASDRMSLMQHGDRVGYRGRSNVYMPAYFKVLNTRVAALSKSLFPTDEYLDATPLESEDSQDPAIKDQRDQDAKAAKAYIQWELDTNAKVRSHLKPFLRQFENYGTACLKYWFRAELKSVGRSKKRPSHGQVIDQLMASMGQAPGGPTQGMEQHNCTGLSVSARNMQNVYVYPITADSLEEVTCIFEEATIPKEFVEHMGRIGRWGNIEAAIASQSDGEYKEQILLNDAARVASTEGALRETPLGGRKRMTEVWCYLPLPKDAYTANETPGEWLPAKVTLIGTEPVEIIRNPLFTQVPPYLFGRQNVMPGFFYGIGTGQPAQALQYVINDIVNQTVDCGSYTMNPMAIVNANEIAGPMPGIAPGAVFKSNGEPGRAIEFIRPPAELIQYGHQHFQAFSGYMSDFTGAPPVMQGSKAADTATSTQILQHNAAAPLQDVAEDLERDVMVPLIEAVWCLAQQFRTQSVIAAVGGKAIRIDPVQLAARYQFRWLASSQAANKAQRASQAIQLIQAVQPLVPILAQQGKIVHFDTLIERIFSDAFGFRGFSTFIQQMGPPGTPIPGGMDPNAPQGVPPGEPQEPYSMTDQASTPTGLPPQPGEAEAGMDVRDNANGLSALLGGQQ